MENKSSDINRKLVDISTQYSKFNVNQVLTETQLNGFLDYFDDQDRLTRTSLSGVGIVCGFELKFDATPSNPSIIITQGRGVTTDGDLIALQKPSKTEEGIKNNTIKSIQLPSKTFKFFKKFSDNEANYDHFINADDKQIDLWELYETSSENNPRISLSSFPNEELSPSLDEEEVTLKLSDMAVLLYLESYSKDDDLCSQLTCDSQGIEQVSRLRVLLVSKTDAEYIASKDGIFNKHDWYETYTSLPEVSAKRAVLNTRNTKTFKRLKQNYYNVIKNNNNNNSENKNDNENDVLDKLIEGLDLILKKFEIENTISPLIKRVFSFTELRIPIDFQYRYDVLKDFIDTYNEIKEILLHLNVQCCPKIGAFPKHLMLGRLVEEKPYATFRHEFYKSPIITNEDDNYKKVLSLFTRLKELSTGYNYLNKSQEIKITPSQALGKLSNKAVPYYYNVTDSVLKHWNFEKNQSLKHRFNLSYHTKNLVNVPSIQQPLDHNLDHFNFYRIEGHQGKVYQEALADIIKIKEDKGLSFDVKVLSIETDNKNIELKNHKCQFEDLEILLNAWKAEQDCVLGEVSSFLSAFSTESAGKNWLSEKNGYNSIVEKRKQREIEQEKGKIAGYEEELKRLKEEKMSNEEVDKVKKYEEVIKGLVDTGQTEKSEVLTQQYKDYLRRLEEAKFTEEEATKVKEYEESLKELSESDDKLAEIVKKEEYEAYLKRIQEAKMSDEEIAKRKEYEASLAKIEAARIAEANLVKPAGYRELDAAVFKPAGYTEREATAFTPASYIEPETTAFTPASYIEREATALTPAVYTELEATEVPRKEEYESDLTNIEPAASVTYTDAAADMIYYTSPYPESTVKVEMTEEEITKKKQYDDMWQKMGYTETTATSPVPIPTKSTYSDIWQRIGVANMTAAGELEKINQKNIVKEVLANEENTIGKSFYKILEENPKASKNEILALIKREMLEVSKGESWRENEEMKKFILEDTAEVLVNVYTLDNEIPKRIEDIDEEGLTRYKVTIDELCERVRQLQSSYDSIDLEPGTKQITGLLINQLSTVCCSGKKLEILYEEIQKRKDNILIQTKLSEFVKNHPGLEHKAGVRPGGTFVMVYLKEDKEEKAIYENTVLEVRFLKQPQVEEEAVKGESGVIQLWKDEYKLPFTFVSRNTEQYATTKYEFVHVGETIEETVSNFAKYLNKMFSIAGLSDDVIAATKENTLIIGIVDNYIQEKTNFIQFDNPETIGNSEPMFFRSNRVVASSVTAKNTVIADFALPYMCCSDCTPVNFIVPKEPVELSLPEKHICLKEGETIDPIPFKVSPANGEIEAMVPDGIESGLTFDEYGKAFFDSSLTDPSLHGKEIGFTVNEDLTDCVITVYADVSLSVETSVDYNTLKTVATVTYKVSNIYPNLTHKWDFGQEIYSDQVPSENGTIAIMYTLPVNEENTVKPSLLISNGICDKQVDIEPITFDDSIEVNLGIQNTYCASEAEDTIVKLPFTNKKPENLLIEITEVDIEGLEIVDDHLIINLEKFQKFDKSIQFTLGGAPTNASIIVYPDFNLSVKTNIVHNEFNTAATVTYIVSERNSKWSYIWNDGNGKKFKLIPNATDNSIKVTYKELPLNASNTIYPSLKVVNGLCEKEIAIEPITFDDLITEATLTIQNSYCIENEAVEIIKIPFLNKEPKDQKIEVLGEIKGLTIEEDQLIIDPEKFYQFNENIKFTLGGIYTNAIISIGKETEIKVTTQEIEYSWSGKDLYQTFNLTMDTSDELNNKKISRKWQINGVEAGTDQSLKYPFFIEREGSSYDIVATIENENGCISIEKTILNIPYPDFKMEMPENQTTYCLNDEKSYPVTVTPKISNTPYTGKGITIDTNGNIQFSPATTGLTSKGIVKLGILEETFLSLELNKEPKSKFEWSIIDDVLVIENTSEIADRYSFVIGEKLYERVNRSTLKLNIYEFEATIVDIKLTTSTPCGNDTFEVKGVKLREEELPVSCAEETHSRIKEDKQSLPQDVDLPADVRMMVVDTTNNLYEMILSTPEMLNDGMANGIGVFENVFTETTSQIILFIHKQYERGILSEYFIGQIKLLYNMMHCQPHDALMENQEMIAQSMEELRKNLETIKNKRMKFDVNNELKDFLKMYTEDSEIIDYVKQIIKEKLLPQIL